MNSIAEYVTRTTQRGECQCGKCIDKGNSPEPTGHTADMGFFIVGLTEFNPNPDEFRRLTHAHQSPYPVDPFDGKEHGYIELGAWIGDQGLAMRYMALGHLLGLFDLLTPMAMLGIPSTDPLVKEMLGAGLLTIKARKADTPELAHA